MKQNKINQAYLALGRLSENDQLGVNDQWNIYTTRKTLRQYTEFYDERRAVIANKYKEFADADGSISGEKAREFIAECDELNDMDVDLGEYKKVGLKLVAGIKCADIEALEDFVDFTPPDPA